MNNPVAYCKSPDGEWMPVEKISDFELIGIDMNDEELSSKISQELSSSLNEFFVSFTCTMSDAIKELIPAFEHIADSVKKIIDALFPCITVRRKYRMDLQRRASAARRRARRKRKRESKLN